MIPKIYSQMGTKLKEVHSHTTISELSLGSFLAGVYYLKITINNASVTKYLIKSE